MKLTLFFLLTVVSSTIFYSCKSDSPVNTTYPSANGKWTVEKVQLVSAPTNGTASAYMKQALVPFGEVDASFAGYLDFNMGTEQMFVRNTNLTDAYFPKIFFGNRGYLYNKQDYTLLTTSNGGSSWNNVTLPGPALLNEMPLAILNASTLYSAYGSLSPSKASLKLYKSSNGGANWTLINPKLPFSTFFNGINKRLTFLNENIGYALGQDSMYQYNAYKTTDGGVSWSLMFTNNVHFYSLNFFDELHGFAEMEDGQGPYYSRTNDGGATWTEYRLPSYQTEFYSGYSFLNANTGWAHSGTNDGDHKIYKTQNGGTSWTVLTHANIWSSFFKNENEGYGLSPEEMVYKTTDGGLNWTPYYIPEGSQPTDGYIVNESPVFFDSHGKIFTTPGIPFTGIWSVKGKLTNTLLKAITGGEDFDIYAYGDYSGDETENINFTCINYSNGGARASAAGKYVYTEGKLIVTLNLPNNEVWKIKFKPR